MKKVTDSIDNKCSFDVIETHMENELHRHSAFSLSSAVELIDVITEILHNGTTPNHLC